MSYDLNFWKYKAGSSLDHQATYESLSEGEHVDGLEDLPIEQMLARVEAIFADGWTHPAPLDWESENRGCFQVFTTPQFLRVDCYGMSGEDMNRFIDLGAEFQCALYDPQIGTRFDGKK